MRPHNPVANAQPESRPFTHLFGCIKWVENALRITNPRSVIADRHFDHFRLSPRVNLNASALPRFLHRIVRVIEYVQKNLLQLLRIAQCRCQRLFKILHDFHAVMNENSAVTAMAGRASGRTTLRKI